MSEELKACPNCGEDAPNAPEMSKVYNGVVICPECGMSGYIEYWQHRPIEDTLREEINKLKKVLRAFLIETTRELTADEIEYAKNIDLSGIPQKYLNETIEEPK